MAPIVTTTCDSGSRRALDAFEHGHASGATPTERIRGAVAAFTAWHAREQQLARVTQYELDSLTQPGQEEIRALRTTFERKLRREIETGVATGEFQVDDLPTTATAIFSLCIDVARWHKPTHRNIDKLAALYGRLSTQMLQAPPPIAAQMDDVLERNRMSTASLTEEKPHAFQQARGGGRHRIS